jgi:hypothetical protein
MRNPDKIHEITAGQKGSSLKSCTTIHLSVMADELKRCNMAGHPRTAKRKAVAGEECASRKKVEAAASASEREQAR